MLLLVGNEVSDRESRQDHHDRLFGRFLRGCTVLEEPQNKLDRNSFCMSSHSVCFSWEEPIDVWNCDGVCMSQNEERLISSGWSLWLQTVWDLFQRPCFVEVGPEHKTNSSKLGIIQKERNEHVNLDHRLFWVLGEESEQLQSTRTRSEIAEALQHFNQAFKNADVGHFLTCRRVVAKTKNWRRLMTTTPSLLFDSALFTQQLSFRSD